MGATGALAIASLAGSISEAGAIKAEGEFQESQFNMNARINDAKAREAIRIGDKDAAKHGKSIKRIVGSQRAALAAQGVDVNSGTAEEIQFQTLEIGREEADTIRNNAWREAFGFKKAADVDRTSGAFAKSASKFKAQNTLITGGLSAATDYAGSRKSTIDTRSPAGNSAMVFDPSKYGGLA